GAPRVGAAVEARPPSPGNGRGALVRPAAPAALAAALPRVLAGEPPVPGPGRAYAQQFTASAAAAAYLGAYQHLLASRARSRHPRTATTPVASPQATSGTPA